MIQPFARCWNVTGMTIYPIKEGKTLTNYTARLFPISAF